MANLIDFQNLPFAGNVFVDKNRKEILAILFRETKNCLSIEINTLLCINIFHYDQLQNVQA